jgi:hypothetical protein
MSLGDCLDKINESQKKPIKEADENMYHTSVELTVNAELGSEMYVEDTRQKLAVGFEIEYEQRSWGLRAVEIGIRSIEEFSIDIMRPSEEGEELIKTVEVRLDPSDIEQTWISGDAYTATDLVLNMDDKGQITAAEITLTYPEH